MRNARIHIALLKGGLFLLLGLLRFPVAAQQSDVREKIDIDRRSLSFIDEHTLEKTREFIRMDSTYYIGYMYEGAFKFYRAADELGFRQVIVPLEKAMRLIEKDYDKELRTRTSDFFSYYRVSNYQSDYCYIAYWLEQSYQNIEEPGKAMDVLLRLRARNIQMETGIETFNTIAWIYHRNRVYTPASGEKYAFLKNSVKENDEMAHKYLDSALWKVRNDMPLNVGLFDASYLNRQYLYTYHYKAILFDYELEIDSAQLYYDVLMQTGYYSSNNYAEFQHAIGEFRTADEFFHEAEQRDGSSEKRTREYFYMRGSLDLYRARPQEADSLLRKLVKEEVATPGYGWHSIALARALHYEGLTAESQERINKAAKFNELHIGTTWGQEQYNLAVATLNFTNKVQFAREHYFENDEWWFWLNPVNWYEAMRLSAEINQQKLILVTLVAENPERAQVIYPIFASENLITFDEVWSLIDGFGNEYFIGIYERLLENDKRPKLKKYFSYFLGRLYLAEGNESKAVDYFEQVLADPETGDEYQAMLYARTCEGMALATSGKERDYWTLQMYETFPQLVPYSELEMRINLKKSGDVSATVSAISGGLIWFLLITGAVISGILYFLRKAGKKIHYAIISLPFVLLALLSTALLLISANQNLSPANRIASDLQNCAIDFVDDSSVPTALLEFTETADATIIDYKVFSSDGSDIVAEGSLRVGPDQVEEGGQLMAYRLFGIKKEKIGEEPKAVAPKKKEDGKEEDKRIAK